MPVYKSLLDEILTLKIDDAYKVEKLSDYQYRINDRLDVYINDRMNRLPKYHDIKTNEWGQYARNKLYQILNRIFT